MRKRKSRQDTDEIENEDESKYANNNIKMIIEDHSDFDNINEYSTNQNTSFEMQESLSNNNTKTGNESMESKTEHMPNVALNSSQNEFVDLRYSSV